MAQEIKMPDLGSDIEEGVLLNWIKQPGEQINEGDVIAEIETDKATVEVPATASGTIINLIGEPGATLKVGSVIGYVGAAGESAPANGGSQPARSRLPASGTSRLQQQPLRLPRSRARSGGCRSGRRRAALSRWRQSLAGRPQSCRRQGHRSQAGAGEPAPAGASSRPTWKATSRAPPRQPSAAAARAAQGIAAPNYGTLPSGADVEIIDVAKMRTRIANVMVNSKQQVPHFYVTIEIDVEALLNLRKQINAGLDDAQKVTVNDLIVKATALTLREFPNLNTHFYGDKARALQAHQHRHRRCAAPGRPDQRGRQRRR